MNYDSNPHFSDPGTLFFSRPPHTPISRVLDSGDTTDHRGGGESDTKVFLSHQDQQILVAVRAESEDGLTIGELMETLKPGDTFWGGTTNNCVRWGRASTNCPRIPPSYKLSARVFFCWLAGVVPRFEI